MIEMNLLAYPDALYSSKTLQRYNVSVGTVVSVHTITSDVLEIRTTSNKTGWVYYRYEDIQSLLRMTASSVNGTKNEDNVSIPLPPENSWISRAEGPSGGSEVLYLHIVDHVETIDDVVFIMNLCTSDCSPIEMPFMPPTTGQMTTATPTMPATSSIPQTPTPTSNA